MKNTAHLHVVVLSILFALCAGLQAQEPAFDVATVKLTDPGWTGGRFFRMENDRRFVARNYTLKLLLAVAFDLNAKAVSGGPAWMETDRYDVVAVTPGSVRPTPEQQRAMLRVLLVERFGLTFHREPKEFAIYVLSVGKGGPKLKPAADAEALTNVVCTVEPNEVILPAVNVSMRDVTLMMQRAIFDRPVVDQTGLTGRYDFRLEWTPDDTQFGGQMPPVPSGEVTKPPLFVALAEQLGLKMEATHGKVDTMVVDRVQRPSEN